MKHKTNITDKRSAKIGAQDKVGENPTIASRHCTLPSGLNRDIVLHSLLIVSVLINLFFLAGYLVIGSDVNSAHAVGSAIYNL